MSLLTEVLVRKAIALVLPALPEIVKQNTWGPGGVAIAVDGNGLSEPVVFVMEELGDRATWKAIWNADFVDIALQKLSTAHAGGNTSFSVVNSFPWLLNKGDSFYQGAVATDRGLVVSVSGAYSETDEAIAWMVFHTIKLLCLRQIMSLRKDEQTHL